MISTSLLGNSKKYTWKILQMEEVEWSVFFQEDICQVNTF